MKDIKNKIISKILGIIIDALLDSIIRKIQERKPKCEDDFISLIKECKSEYA